ncbi:hypothetical protein [Microseira sp. BLCC-F43]|uniref:hypothetical protein n=1 Tax=Microseira sp. BLCC-F43 TaxID=3153602 RepID=UPI0035B97C01
MSANHCTDSKLARCRPSTSDFSSLIAIAAPIGIIAYGFTSCGNCRFQIQDLRPETGFLVSLCVGSEIADFRLMIYRPS